MFLYFDSLLISPILKRANEYAWFCINRLHFNCSMIFIVVFSKYIIYFMYIFYTFLIYLLKIHIFANWSHVFGNFILYGSNKSFSSNRFFFIMQWIHFSVIFFLTMILLIYYKICCLYLPIILLVWVLIHRHFLKSIRSCDSFFIF